MGSSKYYASGTNMAYKSEADTTWTHSSARQGAYNTNRFFGVAQFGSIGSFDPKGKTITNIRLTMDFNQAGGNHNKTLYMFRAAKSTISGTGAAMLGASMGTLKGLFYANAQTWDFNPQNESFIFNALVNMLQNGGTGLAFYVSESKQADVAWSVNYLSIAAITITISWADDYVYYNRNGVWIRCSVHVYQGGAWKRCRARYSHDGTWK